MFSRCLVGSVTWPSRSYFDPAMSNELAGDAGEVSRFESHVLVDNSQGEA